MLTTNTQHRELPANEQGRDFILADLHGLRSRLSEALKESGFDTRVDRVFSVGDLIDRGPDSPACIELLQEPWFHAVRGNHEQLMIDAVLGREAMAWSLWVRNGGSWALEQDEADLEAWTRQLDQLPLSLTVAHAKGDFGLCHAQYVLPHWRDRLNATAEQQADWIWGRGKLQQVSPEPVAGIDRLFHGHSIVNTITCKANSVYLDLGAYNGGPLMLLNVADWLSNEPEANK